MRRAGGVLALFRSALLGLVLVTAAQPGAVHAPDLGKRWAAAPPSAIARVPAPRLGKRWS